MKQNKELIKKSILEFGLPSKKSQWFISTNNGDFIVKPGKYALTYVIEPQFEHYSATFEIQNHDNFLKKLIEYFNQLDMTILYIKNQGGKIEKQKTISKNSTSKWK